jgi:hypothetical protein
MYKLFIKSFTISMGVLTGLIASVLLAVTVGGTWQTWNTADELTAEDLTNNFNNLKDAVEGIPNWEKSGSHALYTDGNVYTEGNVGIGAAYAEARLEVYDIDNPGGGGNKNIGKELHIKSHTPNLTFEDIGAGMDNYAIQLNSNYFKIGKYTSDTAMEYNLVINAGNVGIGTANPQSQLAVSGLTDDDTPGTDISGKRGSLCITNDGNIYVVVGANCY